MQQSSTILLKRNDVLGAIPALTSLSAGELAINTADGVLFARSSSDGIISFLNDKKIPYTFDVNLSSIVFQIGNNTVTEVFGAVLGGYNNDVDGGGSTVLNGENNDISGDFALIGGGLNNFIGVDGDYSAILGGKNNTLNHPEAFILGSNIVSHLSGVTYVNILSATHGVFGDGTGLVNVIPKDVENYATKNYVGLNYVPLTATSLSSTSVTTLSAYAELLSIASKTLSAVIFTVTDRVGVNTTAPNEALTIVGNVSSTGFYYGDGSRLSNTYQGTDLKQLSGNWQSTYVTVCSLSANWDNELVKTYTHTNFLPLTGGTLTGNLSAYSNVFINNNLTIGGNLTALGTATFANTIFTTSSALSVINTGPGPALYVFQAAGPYDVASFYDGDGVEVLHVGNAGPGGFGKVGVNESFPNKELTVSGSISATQIIYAENGNSANWDEAHAIGTVYREASGTFTTNTLLNNLTGTLTPLTLTNTLTSQLTLNADFNNFKTEVGTTTGNFLPATVYQNASGAWVSTYLTVQENSATNWNYQGTDLKQLSGNWQSTYSTVCSLSSNWQEVYTVFKNTSSTFLTFETDSQALSYNESNQELTISNGNTISLSALLDDKGTDTGVRELTANWESTYTTVCSLSVSWNNVSVTQYVHENFLPLSGGTINNNLVVTGNLTVQGTTSQIDTQIAVTSAIYIDTESTETALRITQRGSGDVIRVEDSSNVDVTPFVIKDDGRVGVGTDNPTELLTVQGNISASGYLYGDGSQITGINSGDPEATNLVRSVSGNWNETYTLVQQNSSTTWVSRGNSILKTQSLTAVVGSKYLIDTTNTPLTATLPSQPSIGDEVTFQDPFLTWNTNNFTINKHTEMIQGLNENLICDLPGLVITLTYIGSTIGWRVN